MATQFSWTQMDTLAAATLEQQVVDMISDQPTRIKRNTLIRNIRRTLLQDADAVELFGTHEIRYGVTDNLPNMMSDELCRKVLKWEPQKTTNLLQF